MKSAITVTLDLNHPRVKKQQKARLGFKNLSVATMDGDVKEINHVLFSSGQFSLGSCSWKYQTKKVFVRSLILSLH